MAYDTTFRREDFFRCTYMCLSILKKKCTLMFIHFKLFVLVKHMFPIFLLSVQGIGKTEWFDCNVEVFNKVHYPAWNQLGATLGYFSCVALPPMSGVFWGMYHLNNIWLFHLHLGNTYGVSYENEGTLFRAKRWISEEIRLVGPLRRWQLTAPCFVYILAREHALNSTHSPIGCPAL